jgi:integrase
MPRSFGLPLSCQWSHPNNERPVKKTRRIANTFEQNNRLYVRASHDGIRQSAPCTNEWLQAQGLQPARELAIRAERIHGALLRKLQERASEGVLRAKAPTLDQAARRFVEQLQLLPSSVRPSDQQCERLKATALSGTCRRRSLRTILGARKRLDRILPRDLLLVEREYEDDGFQPESIRGFMSDIRRFLNWAVEQGDLARSPIRRGGYTLPPGGRTEEVVDHYDAWTLRRIETELVTDSPLERLYMLAKLTGGRLSELLRIRFQDISFHERVILIRGARKNPRKQPTPRAVPLLDSLARYLEGNAQDPLAFVCSLARAPWTANAAKCACKRFATKTEIRLSMQKLRRTAAQSLCEGGLSLEAVAAALGNSVEVLRSWYVTPTRPQWPSEALDALATGPGRCATMTHSSSH